MTTSKTTKRALLFSVLSLLLCASMLIGSTFAWFTDSVTAGKNKIVAGNLDVDLSVKIDGVYTSVTPDTNLFLENALWEPGHVEVLNLKVANLGTLALKYQFGINIANETGSTNKDGGSFKLSDHILFALLDGEQTFTADDTGRADAIAAAEAAEPKALSEMAVDENGVLYPTAKKTDENPDEKLVTLIVYMPTNVGNIANYMTGKKVPTINLGVKLVATQTPFEEDAFGTDYDKDVEYPTFVSTATELRNALKEGGNIELTKDITLTKTIITKDSVIELNGHTLTGTTISNTNALAVNGAKLTVKNGTVVAPKRSSSTALLVEGDSDVTLENCTIEASTSGSMVVATNGSKSKDTKIVIRNSTITSKTNGVAAYIPAGDVTLENCTVNGYVCISGGNVTLDGGTYTSNGFGTQTYVYTVDQAVAFLEGHTGDGSKSFGDAITVLDHRAGYTYGSLTIRNITFNTVLAATGENLNAITYIDMMGSDTGFTSITIEGNTYKNAGVRSFNMNKEEGVLPTVDETEAPDPFA